MATKEQIRRIYALGAAAGLLDRSAGNDDNLHLWVKQFSLKDHISELTEQQADFIIRRLEEYRSQVAPLPELITEETDFTDHKNDTTAHVTADEKGSWNAKAELSDIPTTLPANGGNADISKYIGTWGAPEQYYGSRLKARILFNKFGDSRLGLTTDTNNEIRVDYATNADTLDGKHAEDFINVSATRKLETSINGTLGGTYFCEGSFTPDYPLKADGTEYGHYGLLDVRIYGSICYQTLQFENGIVLHRACVIGSTPWSDWMNINDGGNADTLDGLHANEIASKLIPINKYNRPGSKSTPKRICVHYTGQAGTDADRLALFYSNVATGRFPNKPNNWTSTQYIVGLNGKVIRVVPDNETAYAASGKNAGTLHIEVCYSKASGEFETASMSALRELVQYLMKKYNISAGNVLRHYDLTGKYCPWYYVDENRWAVLHEYIASAAVKPKKLYRVQVGAFSSRENAEQYMNKVKAAGFGAFIVEVDNNA